MIDLLINATSFLLIRKHKRVSLEQVRTQFVPAMNSGRKTHLSDFLYIFLCGFRIYLSISFQINWLSEEFNTSRDMNQTQLSLRNIWSCRKSNQSTLPRNRSWKHSDKINPQFNSLVFTFTSQPSSATGFECLFLPTNKCERQYCTLWVQLRALIGPSVS